MLIFISSVFTIVIMLVRVAFFIVLERKGLRVLQLRQGPNKPRVKGLLQALADGLKLVSKGLTVPSKANFWLFCLSPLILFILSFCLWVIFPRSSPRFYLKFRVLFFLGVSACNVFGLILCG